MAESASSTRTIVVDGNQLELPQSVYDELQSMIDHCHDRQAIALMRSKASCGHTEACDALADPANFSLEERQKMLAAAGQQEEEPKAKPVKKKKQSISFAAMFDTPPG